MRRGFKARVLALFVVGGLLGLPLGLWLLPRLDPLALRLCIGALLALWCPVMLFPGHLTGVGCGQVRRAGAADRWAVGV